MVRLIMELVGDRSFTLTTNNGKRRYHPSRMASHRDPSWHPFSPFSTSQTCQPPSPESMHMPTT